MRWGPVDSHTPFLPNHLSSSPEGEVLELGKETLETASVLSFLILQSLPQPNSVA